MVESSVNLEQILGQPADPPAHSGCGSCGTGKALAGMVRCGNGLEKIYPTPAVRFGYMRHIGEFSRVNADIDGNVLTPAEWTRRRTEMLPSESDREFIEGLMKPVFEPGQFASWIAPPKTGIDNKSGDFEYVKIAE